MDIGKPRAQNNNDNAEETITLIEAIGNELTNFNLSAGWRKRRGGYEFVNEKVYARAFGWHLVSKAALTDKGELLSKFPVQLRYGLVRPLG